MCKHLASIKELKAEEITNLIDLAEKISLGKYETSCSGKHIALMFCENSTRTKFSFAMAAHRLGLYVYDFDSERSSFAKGETLRDTLENLAAIGINAVVIRHSDTGIVDKAINEVISPLHFINGGDGCNEHPTQALLDYYTMRHYLGDVRGHKILIVGDIRHSRVARSNIELLKKFGANIVLCAPDYFRADDIDGVQYETDLNKALADTSIAMFLRIQKERIAENLLFTDYISDYCLTLDKLNKYAPEKMRIMHPGPVNRDVELASDVLDSDHGKVILEQAHNGVFVRMAIFETLLGKTA